MNQNFVVTKGEPFQETFNFKDEKGNPVNVRGRRFVFIVSRHGFSRAFTQGYGLIHRGNAIDVRLNSDQTKDFDSNTLLYKLCEEDTREVIAEGILRVQA